MSESPSNRPIVVVSGLPRSGTSMMMRMLQEGGLEVITDAIREADEDNPYGYFEFEKVKDLDRCASWLDMAQGKAVKIVSPLLIHLPVLYHYKIIFMHRRLEEILASQRQMLLRRRQGETLEADSKMANVFRKHLVEIKAWLRKQPNMDVFHANYNEIIRDPRKVIAEIVHFLKRDLDQRKMLQAIDPALYRQKKTTEEG